MWHSLVESIASSAFRSSSSKSNQHWNHFKEACMCVLFHKWSVIYSKLRQTTIEENMRALEIYIYIYTYYMYIFEHMCLSHPKHVVKSWLIPTPSENSETPRSYKSSLWHQTPIEQCPKPSVMPIASHAGRHDGLPSSPLISISLPLKSSKPVAIIIWHVCKNQQPSSYWLPPPTILYIPTSVWYLTTALFVKSAHLWKHILCAAALQVCSVLISARNTRDQHYVRCGSVWKMGCTFQIGIFMRKMVISQWM